MKRVLFAGGGTGGHLMPALAVADAVRRLHPNWETVFAGARRGIEAEVLPARGLKHHLLPLEPIYRQHWWRNLRWPFLLRRLLQEIDAMLDEVRPDAVIGTGGYVSGPVVWRAIRRRIPCGILDLDVHPGIATRWLAGGVPEIWLGAPEAVTALPVAAQQKARVTGAPITPPDPQRRGTALQRFGLDPSRQILVVTGGSQGSRALNTLLAEWIVRGGLGEAQLLWATGRNSHAEFVHLQRDRQIQVFPFIDPMADAWAVADLCVARAGMMTLAELCAWGIPSILIPLPTAAADHQALNAAAMERAGAAVMLRQHGLSAARLGSVLGGLLGQPERRRPLAAAARARGKPDAALELAERVAALANRSD